MRVIAKSIATPFLLLSLLSTAAAAQDTIRLGYPETPAGAVAVVADKADLWTKNGLKVESIAFAAAINARDAIIGGRLDVGITGLSNFLVGSQETGLVALGIAVDQCASAAVVVKPGSEIKTIADLKGKRIASQTGTITQSAFVNGVLKSAGLTTGDVQMVNLRFQDMISALAAGSVDAVTAVDPFLSSAEHAKVGVIITDFCPYSRVPLIYAASDKFMKNPDLVRKLVATWRETGKLFETEPQRATQIYSDALKARGYELPPEVVTKMISRLNVKQDGVLFSPEFLTFVGEEGQVMQKAGQLSKAPDLAVSFPKQPVD